MDDVKRQKAVLLHVVQVVRSGVPFPDALDEYHKIHLRQAAKLKCPQRQLKVAFDR
ncbi:MAG: hypothetical protein WBF71_14955 [Microthrixaceae bacterium]